MGRSATENQTNFVVKHHQNMKLSLPSGDGFAVNRRVKAAVYDFGSLI